MSTWIFETLAQADCKTLEDVLLAAHAPDPAQLAGRVYDGYNHDGVAHLFSEKFRKAFYQQEQALYGFNQVVRQDRQHYVTYIGSNAKARREFGYNPRPLEEGLSETLNHEMRLLACH